MAGIPAQCTICGLIFVNPQLIDVGENAGITVSGIGTFCPKCGGYAFMAEGLFENAAGIMRVSNAPPRTIAIVKALQTALKASIAGAGDDEVLADLASISPEIENAIRHVRTGRDVALSVVLFAMLTTCVSNTKVSVNLDVNQLVDQFYSSVSSSGQLETPYKIMRHQEPAQKILPNRQQRRQQAHEAKKKSPKPAPPALKKRR